MSAEFVVGAATYTIDLDSRHQTFAVDSYRIRSSRGVSGLLMICHTNLETGEPRYAVDTIGILQRTRRAEIKRALGDLGANLARLGHAQAQEAAQ